MSDVQNTHGRHSHTITDPEVEPKMSLEETLWFSFVQNYHLDKGNAAVHCNVVRFSPITFRLAEHLWQQFPNLHLTIPLREVILDSGQYEEDRGR